jgi:hypothetical protein
MAVMGRVRTHAVQQSILFDHLAGAGEQRPIDVAGRRDMAYALFGLEA